MSSTHVAHESSRHSDNNLGDEGAMALSDALKMNSSLTSLLLTRVFQSMVLIASVHSHSQKMEYASKDRARSHTR